MDRGNYKTTSVDLISKKLKVKKEDIEEYVNSLKGKKLPGFLLDSCIDSSSFLSNP